eukprot:SAG31_NODE_27642_length_422_cov_1.510836_1_plen_104_part_10
MITTLLFLFVYDAGCARARPTILHGTAPPGVLIKVEGYQYSGQTSPLPGSPYRTNADANGNWSVAVENSDGAPLIVAGPCTVKLSATQVLHSIEGGSKCLGEVT